MKRKTTVRRAFRKARAVAAFGSTRARKKVHPIQIEESLATESLSDVEVIALRKTLRFGGENGCLVKVPKPSQTPRLKEEALLALQQASRAQESKEEAKTQSEKIDLLAVDSTDGVPPPQLKDRTGSTAVKMDTEALVKLQRKVD